PQFFFFKQKTAFDISGCLLGSEICIRFRFVILAALTSYPLGIKYTINGKVLSIHCPFFSTQVIDIFDILLIESTHTLDSSPAASIDRLKLTYKHGCVIISPKKKKDFVNHILSINSKVHIKIN
uniref:PH domain-containing protein n=1 Tax=Prevotella aurantiaca TaxID=596085 RepID=UPI0023572F37